MITTHVLDLGRGVPGAEIGVTLERLLPDGEWASVGRGATDRDGRLGTLTAGPVAPGTYRLTFDVGGYQRRHGLGAPFFPYAQITFDVSDAREHFHVPLLLSPFGYTTYRGS